MLDEESRSLQELKALLESACTTVADNSSSSFISQSPVKLASVPSPPRSALEPLKLNSAASTDLFKAVPADDVISSLRKSNSVKRSRTEEPSSDVSPYHTQGKIVCLPNPIHGSSLISRRLRHSNRRHRWGCRLRLHLPRPAASTTQRPGPPSRGASPRATRATLPRTRPRTRISSWI